jgi:hypothetical protein
VQCEARNGSRQEANSAWNQLNIIVNAFGVAQRQFCRAADFSCRWGRTNCLVIDTAKILIPFIFPELSFGSAIFLRMVKSASRLSCVAIMHRNGLFGRTDGDRRNSVKRLLAELEQLSDAQIDSLLGKFMSEEEMAE